jgi:hypothetical protein
MWWAATWLMIGIPGWQIDFPVPVVAVLLGVPAGGIAGVVLGHLVDANDAWSDRTFCYAALSYVALGIFCLWAWAIAARAEASDPEWPMHVAAWIGAIAPVPLWVLMFRRACRPSQ